MSTMTRTQTGMRLLGVVLFVTIATFGVVALFTNDWMVALLDLGIVALVIDHKRRQ